MTKADSGIFHCNEKTKACQESLIERSSGQKGNCKIDSTSHLPTPSDRSSRTSTTASNEKRNHHQELISATPRNSNDQPLDLTTHNRGSRTRPANDEINSLAAVNATIKHVVATDVEEMQVSIANVKQKQVISHKLEDKQVTAMNDKLQKVTVTNLNGKCFPAMNSSQNQVSSPRPLLPPPVSYPTRLWPWSPFWMPLRRKLLFPGFYHPFTSPNTLLPSAVEEEDKASPSANNVMSHKQPEEFKENYAVHNPLAFRHLPTMVGSFFNTQNSFLKRQHTNDEVCSTSPKLVRQGAGDAEPTTSQAAASSGSPRPQPVNFKPCQLPCDICGRTYATVGALAKHAKTHEDPNFGNKFNCKICKKECSSLGALRMHIRTHTLPCECHICGKAFSRTWLLQGHIRTHTGEKPYQCSVCSRAFADRSNLRAHMQTHEIVKRYSCVSCEKTFSRISLLKRHQTHCDATEPQS